MEKRFRCELLLKIGMLGFYVKLFCKKCVFRVILLLVVGYEFVCEKGGIVFDFFFDISLGNS